MRFKFTIQPYQTEAVEALADVFGGQPKLDRHTYLRDAPVPERTLETVSRTDEELRTGFSNAPVALSQMQVLDNLNDVQRRGGLAVSTGLSGGPSAGFCSLDVEMETGTGKTYVYIKTMFELRRRDGWGKVIVGVPSRAIREGVKKSFETMQEHFMEHYGSKARFFVYDSKNLAQIDAFSESADLSVMIINCQAFAASFNEAKNVEGRRGDAAARIIFSRRDDFASRRPIDVIAANRPILVLDEPQKMGGAATQGALRHFRPLFTLNYSATHKAHHELVYALDALDAYNRKLVKRIEVKGFELRNLSGTSGYLYLQDVVISRDKPPRARLELEVRRGSGIKRETRFVAGGADLFALSGELEQYRGLHVSPDGVDPLRGAVSFTDGTVLLAGQAAGDESEENQRRIQIRETIRSHFDKERELFARGVKTLSLFFIDEVANYRNRAEDGSPCKGRFAEIFEEEYRAGMNDALTLFDEGTPYGKWLRGIAPEATHEGYFSVDGRGRAVNGTCRRGTDESDDVSAYDLILKDKEKLLSFSCPVRFIFSHSALREGWDNPNVFQICTLKRGGDSAVRKRQEVGRGLRLCVDQDGNRLDASALGDDVQKVNRLTVVASEGYAEFVDGLQKGIHEDLSERPVAVKNGGYFTGRRVVGEDGKVATVSPEQGGEMYFYLVQNGYVDIAGSVTDKYRGDLAMGTLAAVPGSCTPIVGGLQKLVQAVYDAHALDGLFDNARATKISENDLNENFSKKEFQLLWEKINHKWAYTVSFDGEELVEKSVAAIDAHLNVAELQYVVETGGMDYGVNREAVGHGDGFVRESAETKQLARTDGGGVRYDLVGQIAGGTGLTRKTAAAILAQISSSRFAMYRANPEAFISGVVRLVNEQKASLVVDHVSYDPIDGCWDSAIFTASQGGDMAKAFKAKKNVQDWIFPDGYAKDGKSVERRFAEDMDAAAEVCVYAKLPRGFAIPTPVGNYSPDWAIAFHAGTVKHVFFVAETKGSMESLQLRGVEKAKIDCARRLFASLSTENIVYDTVDSYASLLNLVGPTSSASVPAS